MPKTFDGRHVGSVGLCDENGTGFHGFAVHGHGAGPAMRGFAADVRAGDAQPFAQGMDQKFAGFGKKFLFFAVHRHRDVFLVRHGFLLTHAPRPRRWPGAG